MVNKVIDLRQRAEERLARHGGAAHDSAQQRADALARELEVTRIELDLQHEDIELQRDEAAAARDRYAALCDFAPVGLLVLDGWSRVLDGNETAWRMLGLPNAFERRTDLALLLPRRDSERLRLQLRRTESATIEVTIEPQNGLPFRALLLLEPAADKPGQFRAAIVPASARASDRSRSTEVAHREPATVQILIVDDDAQSRALARAACEDDGYRVLTASNGEAAIVLAAAERPDCIIMDVCMPKLDGIAACEQIRALPGGSDVAIVFVSAQHDVDVFDRAFTAGGDEFLTKPYRPAELTVRVQTALRLRRIDAERSELNLQLKRQRDALQRLELQKEQLIAFLVHDLKHPVNAIALQALVAQRSGDAGRSRHALTAIGEETRSLLRMIMNLLDISKADEGRLALAKREIDAAALVVGVCEEFRGRARSAGIVIDTVVTASRFHADPELVTRVLANLVDNAICNAPATTEIRVALTASSRGVELRVADAGSGVPPELRDAVFERFRGGHDHALRANRGLGLAFCKLAVEAHRGRIWIEDARPGAAFCVHLPDDKATAGS